jgi:SAM-dependent methyltransferase
VTAVDFSPYAVEEMKRLADPRAPVEILQHDMFELPHALDGAFDYVLQYTCFCAIDPKRREQYADLVRRLLKPGGIYIDLAFPLDERQGGPPFGVSASEIARLFEARGFTLVSREKLPDSVERRRDKEELLVFQKRSAESAGERSG